MIELRAADVLPKDGCAGVLVGRIWVDAPAPGPRVVAVREDGLYDLGGLAPTMSDLCDLAEPARQVRAFAGVRVCALDEALASARLLAPCDLQAIKAAGVTFAGSLVERVIEERARGDARAAGALRLKLLTALGGSLERITPGSPEAEQVKQTLIEQGLWSQYLEVGLGPDPEIFTKAQPMSAVGCGAAVGLHPKSEWNNPEPEIVLAISSRGEIVGATLGNDVNLRDFEGRSALLLSKAKDNNASCAIGPFIRLFDETFTLDDVRQEEVRLRLQGEDGFITEGLNELSEISRDPLDLAAATIGPEHQYPDGLVLFLGTMFVPTSPRAGRPFTHHLGDIVRVSSEKLGALTNVVTTSDKAPPWTFGVRSLIAALASRPAS